MRRLIITVALAALVLAKPKPETYKEKEDFQYSRSSSDDGFKAGYYGAQRGNMGGNYERAHNMDMLAQHQMSGLVSQVDGELGEGAKTRTGSVYTAANSRGIYGSGNYDLTNLKGRNFEEGESHIGSSQSHSSLTSHNSGYRGYSNSGMSNSRFSSSNQAQDSRYHGYHSSGHTDQSHTDNLQTADTSQGHGRYDMDNQAQYNMRYHTQYGSHGKSEYDQSSSNLHSASGFNSDSQSRYITTPVKVVMRPGGRVAIPIAVPTYAVSQNIQSEDKNLINSDAEILSQPTNFNPANKVKHYESSYSYRKEWEKHHTQPADVSVVVVPTENPFPKNSELYDDAQLLQSSKNQFETANLQTAHINNINSQHRANTKSDASRYQSGFNSEQSHLGFNSQQTRASSDSYANIYGQSAHQSGMGADLTNAAENVNSRPKSYHSSYSYHKSWERQGDPYVIKPVGGSYDGQSAQRLTAATSNNAAYSSHHFGGHSRHADHSYSADCDDEGHVRVARSYNAEPELEQQNQQWNQKLEDLQLKLQNLEDLGQQNMWDNLQHSGQQTQEQWDNLQHLGQESQNQWDNLQQLGQQTQDKLEDLDQHSQRGMEQSQTENLEDFSQLSQKEDVLKNFEQQANVEENNETQNSYAQQENFNNWDQVVGFEQSNREDEFNQQAQSIGQPESQQNPSYVIPTNFVSNTNSGDFMKPHVEFKENTPEQVPRNFKQHRNNFWNMNEFNKEFENNYNSRHFSPKQTETHLQTLWDKIDNIAGEYPIDGKTNADTTLFTHEYSNVYHQSQIVNHMQNTHPLDSGWGFIPVNPNHDLPQITTEIGNDGQNVKIHNLFDDQSQISSTTIEPNKISHHFYKPSDTPSIQNPSADEGRGDIGPEELEIPAADKPNRNTDEIKTLSLTNDNLDTKEEKRTRNTEDNNQMRQHKLFGTIEKRVSTTTPIIHISTTDKNIRHIVSDSQIPMVLNNNNLVDQSRHKALDQTHETVETLTHIQQPNLEQQLEDFGQQLQSSWSPRDTLEKGYDQQNMEQQFEDFNQHENVQLNKTPEEIETLSLTKENTANGQSLTELNSLKDKVIEQGNPNPQRQNILFSNSPLEMSTTSTTTTVIDKQNIINSNQNSHIATNPQIHGKQEQKVELLETPEEIQQQNLEQQFEDFNHQLQSSWFPSDNLQQGYDQQNMEQQFDDFDQHENFQPNKTPEEIETLSLTKEKNAKEYSLTELNSANDEERKQRNSNLQGQTKLFSSSPSEISTASTTTLIDKQNIMNTNQNCNIAINPQIHETQGQKVELLEPPEDIQQHNLEQQFEVFHQHENIQDQSSFQDFGQHLQSPLQLTKDVEPPSIVNKHEDKSKPTEIINDLKLVETEQSVENNNHNEQSRRKVEYSELPPKSNLEAVTADRSTENPGFWKSVGSKLSNAKNKVFSWFKSS